MRMAVFDTHRYDRQALEASNSGGQHELVFLEPRLNQQTAPLAAGCQAVCSFVNDRVDAGALQTLHDVGVRFIALRCAGFNHVDLAAAHALVASARFTQLQELRQEGDAKQVSADDLATLAADYLGWQSDQVRLFDTLSLVLSMRVPPAPALDLIDPAVREAAEAHLASLTVEYQRRLLDHQFGSETTAAEGTG